MKYTQFIKGFLTIAMTLCALVNVTAAQDVKETENNAAGENVILRWNRVLKETVSIPGQQPATIFPVRSFAMMHAAMFDAVNSIEGKYTPYLTDVPFTKLASVDAAAAQAARDVLAELYPTRAAIFDAELAASLEGVNPKRAQQGSRVGQIAANRLLAARAGDGWNATPTPYSLPATPGNWQPAPGAAGFTHYPAVQPFVIASNTQFLPAAPPALTSAEYAASVNEVKELGSATSTVRTAEQTQIARLWANVNTPTTIWFVWNNVAATVAAARGTSTLENARLFALLNMSMHDALLTTFTSKYQYGVWRPLTAIRRADEDGNADTAPDAAWTPLIGNPPYPSYAGNHAAIGTSQATILALVFGRDDIAYQHTWDGAGGATRSYLGFGAMAKEEERARVWGGVHFTFDQIAGESVGRNVANYAYQNVMRPRECVR